MTVRQYAACDRDGCDRTLPLLASRTTRAQLAPAGWTTSPVGDLCPDCSKPAIPTQRQTGCPAGLALCGVPCGCAGRNPSHRPTSQRTVGAWGL